VFIGVPQVVIINFPDTGHINPTLPLVAELASRVKVRIGVFVRNVIVCGMNKLATHEYTSFIIFILM
jgi:hypothetical protein